MIKSKYENEIMSERIIAGCVVCAEKVEKDELLLRDTPPQAIVRSNEICTVKEGGYFVLDFGAEICGGVEITFCKNGVQLARARIVFGESVSEAMSELGEKNSCNDHSPRDISVPVSDYSNMRLGYTGFRFVKVQAEKGDLKILGIRAVSELRDIEYKGSFECNDELLNRVWLVGARTVHLNMQSYLWDGIKRDRLVWIGDSHAETSAIMSVFGYNDIVEKSLDLVLDTTPPDAWMNGIPSYSLWWLIIRNDWYMYTGNAAYVKRDKRYICDMIRHILDGITDSGEVIGFRDPNMQYFVDWETLGGEDTKSGFCAVLIMALKACENLCSVIGNKKLAAECREKATRIRAASLPEIHRKQIGALAALAEMCDAKQINKDILSVEPADISAYLGYYVLLARGMAGDVAGALDTVRKYWGRMIELGATSFWESFDYPSSFGAAPIDKPVPEGMKDIHGDFGAYCYKGFRCSLCHGWACGPTPFITRYVLGVKILEKGCRRVSVKPCLGGLKWIRGTYPTPYGNIEIYAEDKNGDVVTRITAPKEIEIEE